MPIYAICIFSIPKFRLIFLATLGLWNFDEMLHNPALATSKGWTEHVTPEGRKFYFNPITRISQWEKPDELKTADELQTNQPSVWREYCTAEGRKYYYNSITGVSTWDLPQGNHIPFLIVDFQAPKSGTDQPGTGVKVTKFVPTSNDKAEEAFMQLLAEKNVDQSWEWEQVLRETISHPSYRAIDSMPKRKETFIKYLDEKKKFEREEKEKGIAELKVGFFSMLDQHFSSPFDTTQTIRSQMSWRKVIELFSSTPEWKSMPSDRECERCWDEWLAKKRKKERVASRKIKNENCSKFEEILRSNPNISVETKWRKGLKIVESDERFLSDPNLSLLEPIDKLVIYQNYIKLLEKEYFEKTEHEEIQDVSAESEQNFCKLLQDLAQKGILTALSKWKEIFPLIQNEPYFLATLGSNQMKSSPLNLFFKTVDQLEQKLDSKWNSIEPKLKEIGFVFTIDTTIDQFQTEVSKYFPTVDSALLYKMIIKRFEQEQIQTAKLEWEKMKREKREFKSFLLNNSPSITLFSHWNEINFMERDFSFLSDEMKSSIFESVKKYLTELNEQEEGELFDQSESKRFCFDDSSDSEE